MSKKATYLIEFKYEGQPWTEYARSQVKSAILRYEEDVRVEFKGAEYRTRPQR
jgi:hypothetical protein